MVEKIFYLLSGGQIGIGPGIEIGKWDTLIIFFFYQSFLVELNLCRNKTNNFLFYQSLVFLKILLPTLV